MHPALRRLRSAAARLRVDVLWPEALVAEAAEILPELPSNEPLAELAGATPLREPVEELLSRALEWEGSRMPSDYEAGKIVAREIGESILSGAMSAPEGARMIWWKVVRRVPELESELGHFVGLASEWEDSIGHRDEYEADIRRAAAELVEDF